MFVAHAVKSSQRGNDMKVTHYKDNEGIQWREIIYTSWNRLNELKQEYEKKGFKCYLNLYNALTNQWILSIKEI